MTEWPVLCQMWSQKILAAELKFIFFFFSEGAFGAFLVRTSSLPGPVCASPVPPVHLERRLPSQIQLTTDSGSAQSCSRHDAVSSCCAFSAGSAGRSPHDVTHTTARPARRLEQRHGKGQQAVKICKTSKSTRAKGHPHTACRFAHSHPAAETRRASSPTIGRRSTGDAQHAPSPRRRAYSRPV